MIRNATPRSPRLKKYAFFGTRVSRDLGTLLQACLATLLVLAGTSAAAGAESRGRMICDVTGTKIVTRGNARTHPLASSREDIFLGTSLYFEYALDDAKNFSVYLFEPSSKNLLIEETFPLSDPGEAVKITGLAEFQGDFSEASLGAHRINYKGSDQLFLKAGCNSEGWSGHYVQTYVGDVFKRVFTLNCRKSVDVLDQVLGNLAAVN